MHDHDLQAENADRIDQKVEIEDIGPAKKKLTIEIASEQINTKVLENFEALQDEAAVPGFRRGRAPMRLLERRFGSEVRKESKSQLIGASYTQALEDHEIQPIGEPDIKNIEEIELVEGEPLMFEVELEVRPEFELPDLESLQVVKPIYELTDEQVTAELNRFCEYQGNVQEVDEPAGEDDYLMADVTIFDDQGEQIESKPQTSIWVAGKSRDYKGHVAGIVIDDLGKQIKGKKAGDAIEISTTGPQQHENEAIADKPINMKIEIRQVQRMVPAKIEDILGQFGMESEDELREQVKTQLEQRHESEQRSAMHQQVTDALVEQVDVELPEGLTQRQAANIVQRRTMDLMYRGMSQKDIEENLAELRTASQEEAQRELKTFFILDKLGKQMDVEVSEAEVNGRVASMAIQQGRRPERMRQELAKNGQLDQMFIQMREQKVIDTLLEKAKIEEMPAEQWQKQQEAKQAGQASDQDDDAQDADGGEAQSSKKKTKKKTNKKTSKKTSKKSSEKSDADEADNDA